MANEKLIFPIGFDLEGGVREVQKNWKTYQAQMQKTIDRNPLKVKIELFSKDLNITDLKEYVKLGKEAAQANKEIAKTRLENARIAEVEARTAGKTAIQLEQQRAAAARREQAELRLANAKNKSADATNRQNKAYGTQLTYIQRLMQRLAIVGALYQATGFATRIREVTAEFELQRVALGAIIKDGYEASKMFEQIKAAAVKSPFEIKDLVSYTKQLAAYKFETKDLFDTTMQLADISAGLSVGMERLVLAVGQVRATGHLRASEARQFTEAGIPLVEELAKKLSEMRGEMVSAGDVMQMISERAISFGMVKEVFDDMTSAGGTFYKMQEKQAETLAGQWSNLKDTLSIMYDEIGRSSVVSSFMQAFIDSTKLLASNWQVVRNVLITVGGLYASFKVYSLLTKNLAVQTQALATATTKYSTAWKQYYTAAHSGDKAFRANAKALLRQEALMVWAAKGTTKLSRAFRTLWATIAANPIGAVLTVLTLVGTALFSAWENSTKLNRELAKIGSEGAMQADQQVRNFERLAKVINESTVGSKKHDDALQELKRTYGELLPARDQDILALVKEKNAHEAITQAIREKIAMQMKEQKINAITSAYGTELANEEADIKKTLKSYGFAVDEIAQIMSRLREEIEAGNITNVNSVEGWNKFLKILKEFRNLEELDLTDLYSDLVGYGGISGYEDLQDYVTEYAEYYAKLKEVSAEMENQTGLTGKLKKEWEDLQKRISDFKPAAAEYSFEYNEAKSKQALDQYKKFIIDNLGEGANLEFFISTGIDTNALEDAIKDLPAQTKKAIRMAAEEYDKLVPSSDLQKLIKEKWQDIAKTTGASMTKLQNYYKKDEESTEDWVKGLQDALKERQNSIAELKKTQGLEGYEDNAKRIKQLTAEADAFKMMIKYFEEFTKEYQKAQKKDSRLSDLKKQISDITNAYKKYIDLRKYMSKEDALKNIATFFPSLGDFEPTYENMVTRLQKLKDEVQAKLAKSPGDKTLIDMSRELEKSLADIKFDHLKTELERKLSRLADDVAKTKTAKDFYDRILGITGDRELSATFTMSVYGESGDELAARTVRQLEAAFDGIDLSSAINYSNFQVNWEKVAGIYQKYGGYMLEANRKTAEELIKNAQKVSAEQIQQWVKELEQVKSYADKRVELARTTAERIREIEQSNIPKEQKDALIEQYKQREQEQASKLEYEAFKDSPAYVEMFNNLDNVSTKMLEHLREKLQGLQSEWQNLDPTELKELQSRLNAIDEKLATRNPFKALANYVKDYYNQLKQGSASDADDALSAAIARQSEAYALLEQRIKGADTAQEAYDIAKARYGEKDEKTIAAKDTLGKAQAQIKTQQKITDKTDEAVESAQKLVSAWDKIKAGGKDALVGIDQIVQALGQSATQIYDAFGGFGGDEADAEYFNSMVQGVSDLSSGIANIASGNPVQVIQGIGQAVSGLSSVFSAGKVKKANKEIARQQEILEGLEYAYGRLENATKDALGSDYVENYQDRMKNLQAQQQAYLKQAEAERSKGKNKDKKKIKEYENAARETADEIKDMYGELQEFFLGTSIADAARDFANSWIDAYKQYDSVTDAMKEKFADMIQNMIVNSLAADVMKKALQPVYDSIDQFTADGTGISIDEASKIAKLAEVAADNANVGMTNLMNALEKAGISTRDTATELSGISKDIATASEESILGLAAGINTQNFYISQIHANVALITQWVQSGGMATQGVNISDLITLQNQHLSHLPNIAANTAATLTECRSILAETRRVANSLDRVIKPKGTQSAYTLNASV